MNIFEKYIKKISILIEKNQKKLNLNYLNSFKGMTVEIPPSEINFDLSCNAAMILGKINKVNPKKLAENIKNLILDNLHDFSEINIAGPGFLNLKLSNQFIKSNIIQNF